MLKRVGVDNFRSLAGFCFEPPDSAVLVGENGTGKSALWEVLAKLQDILVYGASVEDAFPTATLTRWESREEQRFDLELEVEEERFRYELVLRHDREKQRVSVQSETLRAGDDLLYEAGSNGVLLYGDVPASDGPRAAVPFDHKRSFIAALEPRKDNRRTIHFRNLVAAFWLFKLDPPRMTSVSKREEEWLDRSGANFSAWYRSFFPAEEEKAALLRSDLAAVLHGFVSFKNKPGGGTAKELSAVFRTPERKDYEIPIEELSDGQRSLIVLYAVLRAMPTGPALLVVDEPENFVALAEVQPWLAALSSAAEGKPWQRLLMSHNATVIDFMAADAALEVTRPRGGATQIAPLEIDRSEGLRASDVLALGLAEDAATDDAVSP